MGTSTEKYRTTRPFPPLPRLFPPANFLARPRVKSNSFLPEIRGNGRLMEPAPHGSPALIGLLTTCVSRSLFFSLDHSLSRAKRVPVQRAEALANKTDEPKWNI